MGLYNISQFLFLLIESLHNTHFKHIVIAATNLFTIIAVFIFNLTSLGNKYEIYKVHCTRNVRFGLKLRRITLWEHDFIKQIRCNRIKQNISFIDVLNGYNNFKAASLLNIFLQTK